MSPDPVTPLRWYEIWMLRFLARSPRIYRIIVQQLSETTEPAPLDYVPYLEDLYQAPSAERRGP